MFCDVTLSSKTPDWLVTKVTTPTTLQKTARGSIVLTNGLIAREFAITPDFFTLDYYSYEKQASLLRAIGPEAQVYDHSAELKHS